MAQIAYVYSPDGTIKAYDIDDPAQRDQYEAAVQFQGGSKVDEAQARQIAASHGNAQLPEPGGQTSLGAVTAAPIDQMKDAVTQASTPAAKTAAETALSQAQQIEAATSAANKAAQAGDTASAGSLLEQAAALAKGGSTLPASYGVVTDLTAQAWMQAYNARAGTSYTDVKKFYADPEVLSGSGVATSALQEAKDSTVASRPGPFTGHGARGEGTSTPAYQVSNAADLAAANGGSSATVTKYYDDLSRSATAAGVPWQVLFGVINAENRWNFKGGEPQQIRARIDQVAKALGKAYKTYGDWGVAALTLDDPAAAKHLYDTGEHAAGRGAKDAQFAQEVFGSNSELQGKLGWDGQNYLAAPLTSGSETSAKGPGGASQESLAVQVPDVNVNRPDDSSVRLKAQDLIRSLYHREATPEELAGFSATVNGIFTDYASEQYSQAADATSRQVAIADRNRRVSERASGAGAIPTSPYRGQGDAGINANQSDLLSADLGGQGTPQTALPTTQSPDSQILPGQTNVTASPDWNARLEETIKSSPEYQALYQMKPDYMDEQSFTQQFLDLAGRVLGQNPTGDQLRSGMAQGSPDTFAGRLALSGQAEGSSTLKGRLYSRAADMAKFL